MAAPQTRHLLLGLFIITAIVLMSLALYLIGSNQNIFGSNFKVVVLFNNVSGLHSGSNVRFAGTDVGTVKSVDITSDSTVSVLLLIKDKYSRFIRKDAIASIGTDGLMGNKLVNLINTGQAAAKLESGDTLLSLRPVETDEMLRTLNQTNEYVSMIALNLKNITDEIGNSRGTLWKLLTDKGLSDQLDVVMRNVQQASNEALYLANNLNGMAVKVKSGQGMLGAMVNDTSFYANLQQTMFDLRTTTESAKHIVKELDGILGQIDDGKGTFWTLVKDTNMRDDLKLSIEHIKIGADNFNQNMEALKATTLLRGYFKDKEKKKK
ncbi:MAG: MlaD family protein [Bacteroidota bacterium]|jgi:phospholipid/cholesterol/gamma-HCH transport system substrate-binding protein|nr:MlaD family protein [Sphingobacteriales bacterium]